MSRGHYTKEMANASGSSLPIIFRALNIANSKLHYCHKVLSLTNIYQHVPVETRDLHSDGDRGNLI